MVLYEVTLTVDSHLLPKLPEHMLREHIPQIFATGCFQRIRFDHSPPSRFRTSYEARDEAELQRYLREHAPRLRSEFQALFPTGVTLTRETWTPMQSWDR
jgi:hypothetical protein